LNLILFWFSNKSNINYHNNINIIMGLFLNPKI